MSPELYVMYKLGCFANTRKENKSIPRDYMDKEMD